MSTHDIDIELPPLPQGYCANEIRPNYAGQIFLESQIKAYALTAIEADRKRRGEPVGMPINASQAEKDAYIKGFCYGRRHTLERPDEWKLAVDHELTNIQSTADS